MMLVTLQQASDQVKRDTTDDDADLTLKVKAASRAVVRYLKTAADAFLDSAGDPHLDSNGDAIGVPEDVQLAVLFLVGWFYRNRDEDATKAFEEGRLPAPVTALLYPMRKPTLA